MPSCVTLQGRNLCIQDDEGQGLCLALDQGGRYRIVVHHANVAQRLIADLFAAEQVGILPRDGGVLGGMTVGENFSLALGYGQTRQDVCLPHQEADLQMALRMCGMDDDRLASFSSERPSEMDFVDRWTVGLVRNILLVPELLVMDRIFESCSRNQAAALLRREAVFHTFHPFRPVLYVDVDSHELPPLPDSRGQHVWRAQTCLS